MVQHSARTDKQQVKIVTTNEYHQLAHKLRKFDTSVLARIEPIQCAVYLLNSISTTSYLDPYERSILNHPISTHHSLSQAPYSPQIQRTLFPNTKLLPSQIKRHQIVPTTQGCVTKLPTTINVATAHRFNTHMIPNTLRPVRTGLIAQDSSTVCVQSVR